VQSTRTLYLLAALAGAAGLYVWYRSRAASDAGGTQDAADGVLNFLDTAASRVTNLIGSRGYRNNNPGNLRTVKTNPWQGQIADDGGYGVYDTPENGTRALGHQLRAYATNYGIDTVTGIITRWAPASDNNNTAAYIGDVSTALSVNPDDSIDVEGELADLAQAIARHENGYLDSSYDWQWVYNA
jgi:hypothetical protein